MEAVIITHAADLDGISSAALLMRQYNIGIENVVFTHYQRESIEMAVREADELFKEGGTLFITDLNPGKAVVDLFSEVIDNVKAKNGKVFWFDHHPWDADAIRSLGGRCDVAVVGENKDFCAAEITAREIRATGAFVKPLLRVVHHSDFNITPKDKKTYNIIGDYVLSMTYFSSLDWDSTLQKLREMTKALSNEIMIPEFVHDAAVEFTKINDKRLNEMEKTVINGGVVAVGFSPFVGTSEACRRVSKVAGTDIGVYINVDECRGHLRSEESDCSKLAQAFGGGGHPHASGFEFDSERYNLKTQSGRGKLAQDIIQKALELYK